MVSSAGSAARPSARTSSAAARARQRWRLRGRRGAAAHLVCAKQAARRRRRGAATAASRCAAGGRRGGEPAHAQRETKARLAVRLAAWGEPAARMAPQMRSCAPRRAPATAPHAPAATTTRRKGRRLRNAAARQSATGRRPQTPTLARKTRSSGEAEALGTPACACDSKRSGGASEAGPSAARPMQQRAALRRYAGSARASAAVRPAASATRARRHLSLRIAPPRLHRPRRVVSPRCVVVTRCAALAGVAPRCSRLQARRRALRRQAAAARGVQQRDQVAQRSAGSVSRAAPVPLRRAGRISRHRRRRFLHPAHHGPSGCSQCAAGGAVWKQPGHRFGCASAHGLLLAPRRGGAAEADGAHLAGGDAGRAARDAGVEKDGAPAGASWLCTHRAGRGPAGLRGGGGCGCCAAS